METQEITSVPIWSHFVPNYVNLYYVDYNDNLDHNTDIINKCVQQNSFFPLSEMLSEWWDCPEWYALDEIRKEMDASGFDYVFDECQDDIREWLWDHDTSTPIEDLLRNTRQVYFYDLGVEIDGWHEAFFCTPWRGESVAQAAYRIRRKLGIGKDSEEAKQIYDMCNNASGGHLRIYFEGNLPDFLKDDGDWKTIVFNGCFKVAIYNPEEGSGDYCTIKLNRSFTFNRANIFLSCESADRYPLDTAWGMCGDWCRKADKPQLSMEPSRYRTKTSSTSAMSLQEAEYERVFKTGGCTRGDTSFKRHRNVHYINEYPCRLECPHCGQEWID